MLISIGMGSGLLYYRSVGKRWMEGNRIIPDVQAVCMVVQKAFQWLIIWQQITSHTDILLKILVLSNAGEAENTEFVQIHLPPCLHFFSPEGCTHTYTTWVKLNIKRTNDSVIEAKFSRELSGQQWGQTIQKKVNIISHIFLAWINHSVVKDVEYKVRFT